MPDENLTYVITYVQLKTTREDGAQISDVFIGGIATTIEEANSIAKSITKTRSTQSKTIIPKINITTGSILLALNQARKDFNKIEHDIYEAETHIKAPKHKYKPIRRLGC